MIASVSSGRSIATIAIILAFFVFLVWVGVFSVRRFVLQQRSVQAEPTPSAAPLEEIIETKVEINPVVEKTTSSSEQISGGRADERYKSYTLNVPAGWQVARDTDNEKNVLLLSKDQHTVQIAQLDTSRRICDFEMELGSSQPSVGFDEYEMFTGYGNQYVNLYRRGWNTESNEEDVQEYVVCEKHHDGFVAPSNFGLISYNTPWPANEDILHDMDQIVGSVEVH